MKRCEAMIDAGRRKFLTGAGVVAVGAATATVAVPEAKAAPSPARVVYPSNRLANIRDLKVDDPLRVSYPIATRPACF
jgi:arsenite oxidase small subunit